MDIKDSVETVRHLLSKGRVSYEFVYPTTDGKIQIEAFGRKRPVTAKLEQAGFEVLWAEQDFMDDEPYVTARVAIPAHDYTTGPMPAPVAHKIEELNKIEVNSRVTRPGSTRPGEVWIVTDIDPDIKTNDPTQTLLSLKLEDGDFCHVVQITQVKLDETDEEPLTDDDPCRQALVNLRDVIVHRRHPEANYNTHEQLMLNIIQQALGEE